MPRSSSHKTKHDSSPHIPPSATSAESQANAIIHETNPLKRVLLILGPGLITGASDDDPSGIGTYAVAGASAGFATIWMAPFSFPLMATVQYICAKIGMVSFLYYQPYITSFAQIRLLESEQNNWPFPNGHAAFY